MITTENIIAAREHVSALEGEHAAGSYQGMLDAAGIQSDESMLRALFAMAQSILRTQPEIKTKPDVIADIALTVGIAIGAQAAREEVRGEGV